MADYYSILEKTISGLPNNTPEIRNAVFKKARTAIETQLRNMDPTPSEDAISSQLNLLEEAILVIDSEYNPIVEEAPVADLPDFEESAPLQEREQISVEPETAQAVQETTPVQPVSEPVVEASPAIETAQPAETLSTEEVVAPVATAPTTQEVLGRVENAIDNVQGEVSSSIDNAAAATVSVDPETQNILDPIVTAEAAQPAQAQMDLEEKKFSGFLGGLVKLLVVLGVLGGAGFAIWKNKDELTSFANDLLASSQGTTQNQTSTNNEPITTTEIETPTLDPVEIEPVISEPETAEIVEPEVAEPEVIPEPESETTAVVEPEATPDITTPEVTQPTTQENAVIPIGEVAYLYEEGTAGSGATRTNAAVTWELTRETLAEGSAPEPVIIGKMDVADKGVTVDIKLKRNIDEAVSASHLIEMKFNLPADFSGQSVESIARFVMKNTEEAPGEPLVAVPVKVGEGSFLIALDNLKQAVAVNTQLIKESAWIDVPIVYGTGKRALITLEKGGTGARIFDEAFTDWQNR